MEEFEVGVEEVVAPDNMYDTVQVPSSKNQKNSIYIEETTKAIANGEDPTPAIQEVAVKDVSEIKKEAAVRHVESTEKLQAGVVEEIALSKPEALPEAITSARTAIEEAGASILAHKYAWVNEVSAGEDVSEEEKMSVALNAGLVEVFTRAIDERSFMGDVADFFGSVAFPDSHINIAGIKGDILGDSTAVMDILTSPEGIFEIKGYRDSLSVNERALFDETILIPSIQRVTDNKNKQAELARTFAGMSSVDDAAVWAGVDMADSTLIASQLGSVFFRAARAANSLHKLSKLKRNLGVRAIADAVTKKGVEGVDDNQLAKSAGINPADAAAVGNPLAPQDVFDGAPAGVQAKYRNYLTNVEDHLERARNNLNITINPTKTEELEIAASVEKRMKKEFDLENFKYERTDTGLKFTFDKYDGDDLIEEATTIDFELNDLGGLQQSAGSLMLPGTRHILSPLAQAGKDAGTFIKSAAGAMFATNRAQTQYGQAFAAALKPIKGLTKRHASFVKSADKIDGVMRALENTIEIPTYQKLVKQGVNGVRLTENEFVAYQGVRKVIDDLFWDNNDALRREWAIQGVKSISGEGRNWFGKAMDDVGSATKSYQGGSVGIMENGIISGSKGSLSADEIAQLYSEGKVLVRSWSNNETEWFQAGQEFSQYAIVPRTEVGELPTQVLNKVNNYVPRIHEDANYFLKKKETVVINGKSKEVLKTVAFGETKAQVIAHRDNVIAKMANDNPDLTPYNPDDYEAVLNRQDIADASDADTVSLGGGLIRGHRSTTPIVYAGTDSGKQTNVIDSVQSYLSVTADKVNMGEWRAEARHRIIEEAASYSSIAQAVRGGGWGGLKSTIQNSNIASSSKDKILTMYDQVDAMSRIPTMSEKAFQSFMESIGERFDNGVLGVKSGNTQQGVAKFMYKWSDENPTNIIRSNTFNLTLGMFNPAQIITQASGITAAYSIHPIHALAATPRWLAAAALDFGTNEKAAEGYLKMLAKDTGVDAKSLSNDYKFWRKSGMYDSVVAGNADAASLKLGLPYDAGLLRRTFAGVVEKGRAPFNIGEIANMRVSFFTALERQKKLKGEAFTYSDADLKEVLGRAEDLRLNMSSANKSNIQKGFLSLPMQFLNIVKATAETALSKNMSAGERGRFALGQMTLYGTAGIPLVGFLADKALNAMGIRGEREEGDGGYTSEELIVIKKGILGKMAAGLGLEAEVTNKLTLASDIYTTIKDNLFGEDVKIQKAAFGASYRTGDRYLDVLQHTINFGKVSIENLLDDDADPLKQKLVAIELAKSLISLPSSTRQLQAGLDLHQGLVKRSDGSPLMNADAAIGDVYATAIGYNLAEINDRYKLAREERDLTQQERDEATRIISLLYTLNHGLMGHDFNFNPEASQQAATILIDRIRDNRGQEAANRVLEMVKRKIHNPNDWKEKSTNNMIKRASEDSGSAAMNLDITTQKILERQGK